MKVRDRTNNFPVVCVGGSAGGLDAYTRLLRHLRQILALLVIIVNHLRTVATLLHRILPGHTTMPVDLIYGRIDHSAWAGVHYSGTA